MDVRLSPEQRALRDSAAQIVDRLGPRAVGQLDDAERAAKLRAAAAAAGWHELRDTTGDGSPLASTAEVAIVAEELGRGLADAAFLGPMFAAELRRLAAVSPAAAPATIALEPDLSAVARVTDSALPPGAVAVDALGSSSALLLVPYADEGYSLAQADLQPAAPRSDLTRPAASLAPSAVTPVPGQGRVVTRDAATGFVAFGLAVTCADLVGVMRGAVRLACDYAKERRQYGVAVGSFQAVQHLLADAHVLTEGSRSLALHAAWAADALPPHDALDAAAVAKAYCARAARTVCETAIQVHGGIGNTWECLAHVYLRRALLSSDILGGVGPSLARALEHRRIHGMGGSSGLR